MAASTIINAQVRSAGRAAPVDLRDFECQVYSQNGEDGIIEEILRRVGVKHRFFVEFGVETGRECNSANLVRDKKWTGVFLEPVPELFVELCKNFQAYSGVRCTNATVDSDNIQDLLAAHAVPKDFDLLSIDIDGNDYWVWQAIRRWQPRIVVIEYNAVFPPPTKWVMKENPEHRWNGTSYFGASLASLATLGEAKGYRLVTTDSRGVNAFFVRSDLWSADRFIDADIDYHYSPFNHPACPGGHPPGAGPFVEV